MQESQAEHEVKSHTQIPSLTEYEHYDHYAVGDDDRSIDVALFRRYPLAMVAEASVLIPWEMVFCFSITINGTKFPARPANRIICEPLNIANRNDSFWPCSATILDTINCHRIVEFLCFEVFHPNGSRSLRVNQNRATCRWWVRVRIIWTHDTGIGRIALNCTLTGHNFPHG